MFIVSYNVNGIRSAIAKGLPEWMGQVMPDVLCIQESKAQTLQIPLEGFEALGYRSYWHPALRRGYSGVGILCRMQPDHVEYGLGIDKYDAEGRFMRVDFGDLSVISVYHPNGSSGEQRHFFKMQWLDDFLNYVQQLRRDRSRLVISGDFNICHRDIDIHDPVRHATSSGFLPEEREWMSRFIGTGFTDTFRHFNSQPNQYTWWSFRANARQKNLGWRIDYNMVTSNLLPRLSDAGIMPQVKHSDHCPAWVKL